MSETAALAKRLQRMAETPYYLSNLTSAQRQDLRKAAALLLDDAPAAEREGLCPHCGHEWRRHDPEDGRCDAASGTGPCDCGSVLGFHQRRNAELSRAALDAAPPALRAEGSEESEKPDLLETLLFCPGCFATNEDSSWGGSVMPNYCMNCGHGAGLPLPRWAVRSIREQASWVGKRYYPHDEDREIAEELKTLRAMAPRHPDQAEFVPWENDPGGYWRVTRGRTTLSGIRADTREEALEKAHLRLRWFPPAREGGSNG